MKHLLGKLLREWDEPLTAAAVLFQAVDWRIHVLIPRMWWWEQFKTLNCFIHFFAEVATIDLWA